MTAATPSEGFEALAYHGGDLSVAGRLAPDAPRPWIDLSTGINPYPYPLPSIAPDDWTRLPTPESLARLEAAAAACYGAPSPAHVVAASGSQQIIQMLARILPARRVGVLGATYAGHERAWRAAGATVTRVDALAGLADFDAAVVVNPNNPDGRIVDRGSLLDLCGALARRGATLLVDEAFMDFDGVEQTLALAAPAGSIVLHSFGKSYGLAGLRLGFAIAPPDVAAALRAALGPWPVSGPAIAVGIAALADAAWLHAVALRLAADAARLDRLLADRGWTLVGGTRLFRLARSPAARERFAALLGRGILTRPFADAPNDIRFGIPASETQWRRLAEALS